MVAVMFETLNIKLNIKQTSTDIEEFLQVFNPNNLQLVIVI